VSAHISIIHWLHTGSDDIADRNKNPYLREILQSILEIQFLDPDTHQFHSQLPSGVAPEFAHEKDRQLSIFLHLVQLMGDPTKFFEARSFASFTF
jgi:hypothetical protein